MTSLPYAVESRRAAEERLDRLRDRFGSFPVLTRTHLDRPEMFEHGKELIEEGFFGSAGTRVTDDEDRLLLIQHPRYPDKWVFPGGGHEPGETLVETAEREAWEEAGVECRVTDVWRALLRRYVHEDDPEQRGYLLEVTFEADATGGEVGLYPERWEDFDGEGEEQILAVDWFESPPESAVEVVTDPRGRGDR